MSQPNSDTEDPINYDAPAPEPHFASNNRLFTELYTKVDGLSARDKSKLKRFMAKYDKLNEVNKKLISEQVSKLTATKVSGLDLFKNGYGVGTEMLSCSDHADGIEHGDLERNEKRGILYLLGTFVGVTKQLIKYLLAGLLFGSLALIVIALAIVASPALIPAAFIADKILD